MEKAWNELRRLFQARSIAGPHDGAQKPYEHLKPIFDLLIILESKRDDATASERDLFVLEALLASEDRFREMEAELE